MMNCHCALISVIVPVYNVEVYLSRCIESIINQTYQKLEIILVNDGSKDRSGIICDDYKTIDSRIKVIHKKNGGLSDARNAGLEIAKGAYISFIDSDDWIELNMIEKLLNEAINNCAEIAIGRRYRVYQNESKKIESFQKYPGAKIMTTEKALECLMSFCGFDMSVCDKLFKRELFTNIVFPYGKTCEDSFIIYKVFSRANRLVYVNIALYNYFFRENSITRNNKVNETVIEATFEQMQFINRYYPKLKSSAASSYVIAILSVFNEYIKRHQKWNNILFYKKEARKYLKMTYKNKYISYLKKLQILLFAISITAYKSFYIYIKKIHIHGD